MRRIRITGLCLVAAFVMSAVASATASAALPELGRCVAVSPPTAVGEYSSSKCTEASKGGVDPDFNWLPGPGAKPGFKGSATTATLEAVNKSKIKCTSTTDEGKWTGPKNAELTSIVFKGCESVTLKAKCNSVGAVVGEIVNNPLEQALGFITKPTVVGVDLTPTVADAGILAKFECGGVEIFVTGSVVAPITAINTMSTASTTKFKGKVGKQEPEHLEGLPKDTLETHIPLLGTVEQSAEIVTSKNTNEEKLEIKAS
jgi:hypothetical protein